MVAIMRAVVSGTTVLVVALRTVVWRAIDSGAVVLEAIVLVSAVSKLQLRGMWW